MSPLTFSIATPLCLTCKTNMICKNHGKTIPPHRPEMFYSVHHYYTQACTSVLPRIVGALAHMQPKGAVEETKL